MLRADFHHHINTDPVDGRFVRHSAGELIDAAAARGLNVLAITCHESLPYDNDVIRYAADRGVLLLLGMEATVDNQHVLLLNFREFPAGICTMDEVVACKTPEAVVVAPHPFYPAGVAGGATLAQHAAAFDAVEFSGLYTPLTQRFNRRAMDLARRARLPVIGNTDTHFLWQLGRTYSLIDADPTPASVIDAIRRGRVQLITQPLSWVHIVRFIVQAKSTVSFVQDSLEYMVKVLRRTRPLDAAQRLERESAPAARARLFNGSPEHGTAITEHR